MVDYSDTDTKGAQMRVGFISYPTLFQQKGGLQVKIIESMAALKKQGVDVSYMNPFIESFTDFDLIHVFGGSNHRIVQVARELGMPTVLSSVLEPWFSRTDRIICELIGSFMGRVLGWGKTTTYHRFRLGFDHATRIVALGKTEKTMLVDGYRQDPKKIRIIPNGVSPRFREASPKLFQERYSPNRTCILCVASINERKNQRMAASAIRGLPVDFYLIGTCNEHGKKYLETVKAAAPGQVFYQGAVAYEEAILPSAYAAADLMLLPSVHEVMPNSVTEALATGTPVVMTKNHSLDLPAVPGILEMVDPNDEAAIRAACKRILDNPPAPDRVRELVSHLDWQAVGSQLLELYSDLLDQSVSCTKKTTAQNRDQRA